MAANVFQISIDCELQQLYAIDKMFSLNFPSNMV